MAAAAEESAGLEHTCQQRKCRLCILKRQHVGAEKGREGRDNARRQEARHVARHRRSGLRQVATSVANPGKLTVSKTSEGTSWGAVYAQSVCKVSDIDAASSGFKVTREILSADGTTPASLKVGSRIKVRITIVADRDYDFVQVSDKRAACMEPLRQLSGYAGGYYCTPKDNVTNYYFDRFSKERTL